MSCYAPTRAASRKEKDKFYDLGAVLSSTPESDLYVVLGDFNARVRSRESEDQWRMARGPNGHGSVNDAGKLDFSSPSSHS